ncbi:MAG: helix-turn-helix domain-containing protein [Acetobacteraceae bacterium]|nr:helix-turn-helix domain-containing protein [Acetobacteraceae bacterium]
MAVHARRGGPGRCPRALAIAQALEGTSRAQAARLVGRERQSLPDAVLRYNAEDLAGLRSRRSVSIPRGGHRGPALHGLECAARRDWTAHHPDQLSLDRPRP